MTRQEMWQKIYDSSADPVVKCTAMMNIQQIEINNSPVFQDYPSNLPVVFVNKADLYFDNQKRRMLLLDPHDSFCPIKNGVYAGYSHDTFSIKDNANSAIHNGALIGIPTSTKNLQKLASCYNLDIEGIQKRIFKFSEIQHAKNAMKTAKPKIENEELACITVKITGHADLNCRYKILDIAQVKTSHLPEQSFRINPDYAYENERRYHNPGRDQDKVIEIASKLDPAYVVAENVSAMAGAPVVDTEGNVLGGNGRAQGIALAYARVPERAADYKTAVIEFCATRNIPCHTENPILVRQLVTPITRQEGQSLISLLNAPEGDAKEDRADYYSRGKRFSTKTLNALARALSEADSLRSYFDEPKSLALVNVLISDGVILDNEANRFINGGYLNPDGKTLVEASLRSIVAPDLETIATMPAPILTKIDAVIPHILIASQVHKSWNIKGIFADAITLYGEYRRQDQEYRVFLAQGNLFNPAPQERYSLAAQNICQYLIDDKKAQFVKRFAQFAGQAKISIEAGGLGIGMPVEKAYSSCLGIEMPKIILNEADPEPQAEQAAEIPTTEEKVQSESEKSAPKTRNPRTTKNDCTKDNSILVMSYTGNDREGLLEKATPYFGGEKIKVVANSKTQYRVNGHDGFRIIRSGRQWQLRLLNGYVEETMENEIDTIDGDWDANHVADVQHETIIANDHHMIEIISKMEFVPSEKSARRYKNHPSELSAALSLAAKYKKDNHSYIVYGSSDKDNFYWNITEVSKINTTRDRFYQNMTINSHKPYDAYLMQKDGCHKILIHHRVDMLNIQHETVKIPVVFIDKSNLYRWSDYPLILINFGYPMGMISKGIYAGWGSVFMNEERMHKKVGMMVDKNSLLAVPVTTAFLEKLAVLYNTNSIDIQKIKFQYDDIKTIMTFIYSTGKDISLPTPLSTKENTTESELTSEIQQDQTPSSGYIASPGAMLPTIYNPAVWQQSIVAELKKMGYMSIKLYEDDFIKTLVYKNTYFYVTISRGCIYGQSFEYFPAAVIGIDIDKGFYTDFARKYFGSDIIAHYRKLNNPKLMALCIHRIFMEWGFAKWNDAVYNAKCSATTYKGQFEYLMRATDARKQQDIFVDALIEAQNKMCLYVEGYCPIPKNIGFGLSNIVHLQIINDKSKQPPRVSHKAPLTLPIRRRKEYAVKSDMRSNKPQKCVKAAPPIQFGLI